MCGDAREACGASGSHVRADLGARGREDDRKVRDVAGHEQRGAPRMDEVLGEGDDRSRPRYILRGSVAPRMQGDLEAG
jgi:hypothetical protein